MRFPKKEFIIVFGIISEKMIGQDYKFIFKGKSKAFRFSKKGDLAIDFFWKRLRQNALN